MRYWLVGDGSAEVAMLSAGALGVLKYIKYAAALILLDRDMGTGNVGQFLRGIP